jgi:hypothetical protein
MGKTEMHKTRKQKFMEWMLFRKEPGWLQLKSADLITSGRLFNAHRELTKQVDLQEKRIYLLSHLAICDQKSCGIRTAALASGEEYIQERAKRAY